MEGAFVFYREAIEHLPRGGCFLLDRNGRYVAFNEAHERTMRTLTGRRPARGETFLELSEQPEFPPSISDDARARDEARQWTLGLHRTLRGLMSRAQEKGRGEAALDDPTCAGMDFSVRAIDGDGGVVGFVGMHGLNAQTELERPEPDPTLDVIAKLTDGIINELNNLDLGLNGPVADAPDRRDELARFLEDFRSRIGLARRLAHVIAARSRSRGSTQESQLHALFGRHEPRLREVAGTRRLVLESDGQLPAVEVDPEALVLALEELIRNAVEASSTTVTIRALSSEEDARWPRPSRPYVRVEVEDDGEGIGADRLGRVFEPYTGSRTRTYGVGLTRVRALVEAQGGTVELFRGERSGMRAVIRLPAAPPPEPQPSEPSSPPRRSTNLEVFVVDDAPEVRRVLGRVLRHAGHEVFEAEDGVDALEKLDGRGGRLPDVVVLDLMMPRMDGVETYRELRDKSESLPILVTSGYHPSGLGFLTSDPHAAFLPKPFSPAEVISSLEQLVGRDRL